MYPLKILIVDDSKAMLGVAQATLQELGIEESTAVKSGEEALQAIYSASPPYDLIFIDLNMPGMDGIELIRGLSERRYEGGVVILSALDNKILQLAEHVSISMRIRLLGCISKPIDQEKFQAILHKMKTMRSIYQQQYAQLNESEINSALSHNQLIPYYQPKVSSSTGVVRGLEVLARINSPLQMEAITPNQFIPIAESLNLLDTLTYNLIERALQDLPRLSEEFGPQCKLSINISPSFLYRSELPDRLVEIVQRHQVSANRLVLEITESIPVESPTQFETLSRLRIKGFELALDDFGTGFTNIQQLKSLPFNEIKLDRSLVCNIANDHMSQVLTHSLLNILAELDVEIVAEGIDNERDLNYLNEIAIPLLLQGYIITRPKGLEDICRWHHSWKRTIESSR